MGVSGDRKKTSTVSDGVSEKMRDELGCPAMAQKWRVRRRLQPAAAKIPRSRDLFG